MRDGADAHKAEKPSPMIWLSSRRQQLQISVVATSGLLPAG